MTQAALTPEAKWLLPASGLPQDQLVAALATQLDAQALRYATRRNLMAGGALCCCWR